MPHPAGLAQDGLIQAGKIEPWAKLPACLQLSGTDYNSWDTLKESSGNDANMGSIVYAHSPGLLVPQNASVNGVPCGTVFSTWYGA